MSREINIPVTTLAGISNLTDLLLVFPLPSNETDICLIDNGQQRDDCNLLLHSTDVNHTLLNNISKVLQSTSIDHIVLNDDKKVDRSINSKTPYLLKNLTSQHPNIFSRKQPVKPFPTPTVNGGAYPSTKPHASPYQAGHISPGTPHSPKRSTAAVTPAYPQPASLPSKQASITPAIIPNLTVKQEVNTVVKNGKIESSQTSLKNDKIPIESIVKKDVKPITSEIKRPDYKIAEIISRGFEKELIENEMKEKGEFSSPNTPHNAVECQKESERPSCTERLQPDPSPTQESTPAPKTSSKRRRETVSYKDEDSDAEKNPNPPSERREGKRDRNHRHHSSDVREKKRKRDHDKHGKSEHRRSHKSSRRRRHSRRRSSSSPNNNNNSASTEYIRAFVNIDDSKCSSRIAMGTGGAGVSGPGGVQDDGPSESTVLHRFNANMDEMLAEVEDVDLSIVYGHEEDEDVFNEPLVSKNSIRNLLNETSKLNSLGAANKVPYEKLVRLLALLQFSIKDGCRSNAYKSTVSGLSTLYT